MIQRLEAALRKALEEPFARVFPEKLHPLELAAGLRNAARDSRVRGADGTYVANSYVIELAAEDAEQLAAVSQPVSAELVAHVRSYGEAEGWEIGPYVTVRLDASSEVRQGEAAIRAEFAACPQSAYFHVEAGMKAGGKYYVGEQALVGRSSSCDIVIDAAEVSRRHCMVRYHYVHYVLEDMGSANGTFVNGEQVSEAVLGDGDLVEIGLVQLRFLVE
jgi:hypothetical protein